MHSSCADQSKSSVSTWIRPFCSLCRVVCHFPAVFRLNREWQLLVLNFNRRASELFALKLTSAQCEIAFFNFIEAWSESCSLTSALSEIVVFDLRSVKRQRWSSFSPLFAQLSCQPVTYFGLFMKYRHSFATILPQCYHLTTLFTMKYKVNCL